MASSKAAACSQSSSELSDKHSHTHTHTHTHTLEPIPMESKLGIHTHTRALINTLMSIITPVAPTFLLVWLPDNNGCAWVRWWTNTPGLAGLAPHSSVWCSGEPQDRFFFFTNSQHKQPLMEGIKCDVLFCCFHHLRTWTNKQSSSVRSVTLEPT